MLCKCTSYYKLASFPGSPRGKPGNKANYKPHPQLKFEHVMECCQHDSALELAA